MKDSSFSSQYNLAETLELIEYYSKFIIYEESLKKSSKEVQEKIIKVKKRFLKGKYSKIYTEEYMEEEGIEDVDKNV